MITEKCVTGLCGIDFTCRATSCVVDDEDNGSYNTYSIEVVDDQGVVVFAKEDLSTDKAAVESLAWELESCMADVMHLEDLLADWLP